RSQRVLVRSQQEQVPVLLRDPELGGDVRAEGRSHRLRRPLFHLGDAFLEGLLLACLGLEIVVVLVLLGCFTTFLLPCLADYPVPLRLGDGDFLTVILGSRVGCLAFVLGHAGFSVSIPSDIRSGFSAQPSRTPSIWGE